MNLTAQKITSLALGPKETDRIWFDDAIPGFGLRLRDGGSRTWIFQYKIGSRQRRLVLGKATAIKVARAREIAGELHAKVKLGGDPAAEKAVNKVRAANTFGELARRYLEYQKENVRPRSYAEVKRHLELHAKAFRDLPMYSVDQRTIADRLSIVAKECGAVTANRTRASLSAMFGWAMREGLAEANPVMHTGKREEKSRDRVLSTGELHTIWSCLADDQYGAIIKLLALTGQRANEIAGLRWSELDTARDLISLPSDRTKNGRAHQVPMATIVKSILEAQTQTDDRDLVFGYGEGAFSGWSKSKQALDRRIVLATGKALPHWTPHDLRRTVATRMGELDVQPHIIEAVLNHVSGHRAGVAGIYNRAMYEPEKRNALARWADQLLAWVEGRASKITTLRRA